MFIWDQLFRGCHIFENRIIERPPLESSCPVCQNLLFFCLRNQKNNECKKKYHLFIKQRRNKAVQKCHSIFLSIPDILIQLRKKKEIMMQQFDQYALFPQKWKTIQLAFYQNRDPHNPNQYRTALLDILETLICAGEFIPAFLQRNSQNYYSQFTTPSSDTPDLSSWEQPQDQILQQTQNHFASFIKLLKMYYIEARELERASRFQSKVPDLRQQKNIAHGGPLNILQSEAGWDLRNQDSLQNNASPYHHHPDKKMKLLGGVTVDDQRGILSPLPKMDQGTMTENAYLEDDVFESSEIATTNHLLSLQAYMNTRFPFDSLQTKADQSDYDSIMSFYNKMQMELDNMAQLASEAQTMAYGKSYQIIDQAKKSLEMSKQEALVKMMECIRDKIRKPSDQFGLGAAKSIGAQTTLMGIKVDMLVKTEAETLKKLESAISELSVYKKKQKKVEKILEELKTQLKTTTSKKQTLTTENEALRKEVKFLKQELQLAEADLKKHLEQISKKSHAQKRNTNQMIDDYKEGLKIFFEKRRESLQLQSKNVNMLIKHVEDVVPKQKSMLPEEQRTKGASKERRHMSHIVQTTTHKQVLAIVNFKKPIIDDKVAAEADSPRRLQKIEECGDQESPENCKQASLLEQEKVLERSSVRLNELSKGRMNTEISHISAVVDYYESEQNETLARLIQQDSNESSFIGSQSLSSHKLAMESDVYIKQNIVGERLEKTISIKLPEKTQGYYDKRVSRNIIVPSPNKLKNNEHDSGNTVTMGSQQESLASSEDMLPTHKSDYIGTRRNCRITKLNDIVITSIHQSTDKVLKPINNIKKIQTTLKDTIGLHTKKKDGYNQGHNHSKHQATRFNETSNSVFNQSTEGKKVQRDSVIRFNEIRKQSLPAIHSKKNLLRDKSNNSMLTDNEFDESAMTSKTKFSSEVVKEETETGPADKEEASSGTQKGVIHKRKNCSILDDSGNSLLTDCPSKISSVNKLNVLRNQLNHNSEIFEAFEMFAEQDDQYYSPLSNQMRNKSPTQQAAILNKRKLKLLKNQDSVGRFLEFYDRLHRTKCGSGKCVHLLKLKEMLSVPSGSSHHFVGSINRRTQLELPKHSIGQILS